MMNKIKKKKRLHRKCATLIIALSVLSSACSEDLTAELMITPAESVIQPGLTTELIIDVAFVDMESAERTSEASRAALKLFDGEPLLVSNNPELTLLSVETILEKNGIQAFIIIRAGDELLSGSKSLISAEWAGLRAEANITIKKDPDNYIDSYGVVTDPSAYDVLVNKKRRLPADFIPPDLVRVEVPTILAFEEVNHLRQDASKALSAMFKAAESEEGYELLARSGYRSYKTQVMLYDLNVREYGEEYAARISAKPGTSEHQSGLTMDISSPVVNNQLTQDFGRTDEGRWVAENAHRFGFIIRYLEGKEAITGYSYEPWHIRYLGTELAAVIFESGLTLEEYFQQ